ncbi:MAG: hypothetical protein ACTSQJ_02910 [Promethearchaeota archaeon]
MADLFNHNSKEKDLVEDLCVVYILYFDEEKGHVPLLIYPSEEYKNNKKYMRPIKYHSIWFLPIEENGRGLDHIDLEYKGYTFFGKKFLTKSKREKRRAGLNIETPETIVIIVSLPNDLDIFGDELIHKLTQEIRDKFEDKLFEVIECEVAKDSIIKTPKIKECIEKGTKIKVHLRELIEKTTKEYFSKVIKKRSDMDSIRKQKAISYLTLKGFEFSHLSSRGEKEDFSGIKLFDPKKNKVDSLTFNQPLSISNINFIEDSRELEILVKNNTKKELDNIAIKIMHVKDFFEKEIMNQIVDVWYPNEELLFISPVIPHINEYLFFIIEEKNEKKKILSRKIDLNTISKIKG